MSTAFIGHTPTKGQTEKLRLILSTYQDGMGQLAVESEKSLPGWRDFERSVAWAFGGIAQESKAVFDILIPTSQDREINIGISCKVRETLKEVEKTGRVTIEVSNSAGKFWGALKSKGISDYNTDTDADVSADAGKILLDVIESLYREVDLAHGGTVVIGKSFYLILQWDEKTGRYKLFQFPIQLPAPEMLSWEVKGKRLVGCYNERVVIEWYGHSGGQLKYYPLESEAIWSSEIFKLEPLPRGNTKPILKQRVRTYFPELWEKANEM